MPNCLNQQWLKLIVFFFFTLLEMLSKVIVNGQKLIQKLGFQAFKLLHDENYFFSWDN